MLRNGVNVFSLQCLPDHADLQMVQRRLAQTNDGGQAPHMRRSPADNGV